MVRVTLSEYHNQAREMINSGACDGALAICRHILKRYPKHIETYRLLGEACLENGELEEAADVFKRLLNADPENFVAYAGLGVIHEKKGTLREAIWHMERAFELAPNNETIRDALRRLRVKRDGTQPTRIKLNKAALARMYARGSQYRQAIEEFQSLLELDPNRMDTRIALAETLWRDARREEAARLAQEILETSPECLKAILLLGMIHLEKGHSRQAQETLAAARSLDPENRLARAFFGDQSPLPVQTVRIPRIREVSQAEPAPAEAEAHELTTAPAVDQEDEAAPAAEERSTPPADEEPPPTEAMSTEAELPAFLVIQPRAEEAMPTVEAETVHTISPAPPSDQEEPETIAVYKETDVPPSEEEAVPDEAVVIEIHADLAATQPTEEETDLTPSTDMIAVSDELAGPPSEEEEIILDEAEVAADKEDEVTPYADLIAIPDALAEPPSEDEVIADEAEVPAEKDDAVVASADMITVPNELAEPPSEEEVIADEAEVSAEKDDEAAPSADTIPVYDEPAGPSAEEELILDEAEVPTEEEGEVTPSADMIAVPKESVVPSDKEEAVPEELESGEAIAAAPLSDVERYQLQLERKPKDNSIRLALARAYRDQEKVKLALEQYGALVRAKSSLLAQAVADVEGIIASRPDNLEAHELLADLYAKSGQLPKAVDRLRWIQQRLEQKYP